MVRFLDKLLTDDTRRKAFAQKGSADIGYSVPGSGRFRLNVFRQLSGISMVARHIPTKIPDFNGLNLPPTLRKICDERRGLVLVTGTTGSGKSTTLASMLEYINQTKSCHILTIEDPIEFVLSSKKCVISQREIGESTDSFPTALRAALRQDPDIILIGEMRDVETIETALHAAETGHLVMSTMHTLDTTETVNRMVSVFPPHYQKEIRNLVSTVLRWVVSQRLLERADGKGRVPACEIMCVTPRIKDLIKENAGSREMLEDVAKNASVYGTQTFDQALMRMLHGKLITIEQALGACSNPADFKLRVSGISGQSDTNF
jgi:twitching motility protein PilT